MHAKTAQIVAAAILSSLPLAPGEPAAWAQPYEVIDLGTLGGPTSSAWAINNNGQVVGTSATVDSALHGFLWQGTLTDLGPLPGDLQSQALDIGDGGNVAMMSFDLGELSTRGAIWNHGAVTAIEGLAPTGVNTGGAIVGYLSISTSDLGPIQHAGKWVGGTVTDLGTLGGDFSYAYAVNDQGDVVGKSLLSGNQSWHAVLYAEGNVVDLGTLGGSNSQACGINNVRQVVGVADTASGAPHGFLFQVGANGAVTSRTDLATLDGISSYANAINEAGVVVGTSGFRAFRWEAGVMTDLNVLLPPNSGWTLEIARGINDQGAIVGQGKHDGQPRAFLLQIAQVCIPIDANHDGRVDLRDYSEFINHFQGPGAP